MLYDIKEADGGGDPALADALEAHRRCLIITMLMIMIIMIIIIMIMIIMIIIIMVLICIII